MFRRIALVVVAPLLAAGGLLAAQLDTATRWTPTMLEDSGPRAGDTAGPHYIRGTETDDDEVTDLYGNQVTSAVATYTIDATGLLYELHSPQTQLPRPAPPKS